MTDRLTRREALITGLVTLSALTSFAFPAIKRYNISVHLQSLQEEMKTDPAGTLARISKMGYRQIEPAQYTEPKMYGYSASEFRKLMDDLGLRILTSHTSFKKEHWNNAHNDITDAFKQTITDALVTGQQLLVVPYFDWNMQDIGEVKKGIEAMNRMGEIALQSGLRIAYHNQQQEFQQRYNGEYLYDFMLSEWDLKYVSQQLDLANMALAGVDPMVFLKKYPHHYASIHVNDIDKNSNQSTHLGEGGLDLDNLLSFARRSTQIQYWVLAQENYGLKSPFQAMEDNLNRFKRYGFIG